jgi:hypothetical protein
MDRINLQAKAKPLAGRIEYYWFENEHVGLKRTRFHRIQIPFEPFDSGLDYVAQPESTSLIVEWLVLEVADPAQLDGVHVSASTAPDLEASIYLGSAHNWLQVSELSFKSDGADYLICCKGIVQFENEGVGENEAFTVKARAKYVGEA